MSQRKLSLYLKAVIAAVGLSGLIVCCAILPDCAQVLRDRYPELAAWYWPWLVFLWIAAVPCFAALALGWKIAAHIGESRSFTVDNAHLLQLIARLAGGDTLFFFAGNVALLFLNMNHPGILLMSLLVCGVGAAICVAAACLSHLVRKAADLQDESDLTV